MKNLPAILCVFGIAFAADAPRFTADRQLSYPEGYREWVWISSGFGVSLGKPAANRESRFGNLFVDRASYESFTQTGRWPDGTMLVMETRDAVNNESANSSGYFQGAIHDINVEVKDLGKWTFYSFGLSTKPASAVPSTANCYSCHSQKGGVEQTFVQFYPTLLEVARQKGTLRNSSQH